MVLHTPVALQIVVATGFIAKSPAGQATTLRRNGSDLSATILGSLFRCSHITIWTDVDGVYSVSDAPAACGRATAAAARALPWTDTVHPAMGSHRCIGHAWSW